MLNLQSAEHKYAAINLQAKLTEQITQFMAQHPYYPAPVIMSGIADFLIAFAIAHVGQGSTLKFAIELVDVLVHLNTAAYHEQQDAVTAALSGYPPEPAANPQPDLF